VGLGMGGHAHRGAAQGVHGNGAGQAALPLAAGAHPQHHTYVVGSISQAACAICCRCSSICRLGLGQGVGAEARGMVRSARGCGTEASR
jgi:hypothetical protein